ncbi:uncharacterized protein LOC110692261 [Chenopodium quinoa]|uniref:uncharacterized protein LOC110692261 n=1 Tax=Chenopodium quinoa TaxID=63459 RepID=UPI000B76C199|nr:uncharacterized protein LOC110692261 [Chenopodium quinoa]XP_021724950.1 uncharacterized protein LOC110692261 [Chenopodium quinoa]
MAKLNDPTSPPPPTPPPAIGKIGPYTVFLTPPTTPKPTSEAPPAVISQPHKNITVNSPPPVQPPPAKFETAGDRFAFFWEAIAKAQNVHASVDEYVANWLGLDQSRYQWALNDYYEFKGMEKGDVLTKEVSSKRPTV